MVCVSSLEILKTQNNGSQAEAAQYHILETNV